MVFCLKTSKVSTKAMNEIKNTVEKCRVAEFRKSLTLLWHDGVCCKIFRQWSKSYYFNFTIASTVLHSNLCRRTDHLHIYRFWCKKKKKSQKGKNSHSQRQEHIQCVEDEFPPEPTGAQHTQSKHHWTQSRVSRYWACLSAGLYFSLPYSCFHRLWPQFHRGHLLIKGKDWNLQVLSVCSLKPRKFN